MKRILTLCVEIGEDYETSEIIEIPLTPSQSLNITKTLTKFNQVANE